MDKTLTSIAQQVFAGAHDPSWSLASYLWNTEGKTPYSIFLNDFVCTALYLTLTVVLRRKQEWVVRVIMVTFVALLADRGHRDAGGQAVALECARARRFEAPRRRRAGDHLRTVRNKDRTAQE